MTLPFAPRVMTICSRYPSQNVIAQDFMQDCFIHVFEKIAPRNECDFFSHLVCSINFVLIIEP